MKKSLIVTLFLIANLSYSKDKGKGMFYVMSEKIEKVEINIYEKNNVRSGLLGKFVYINAENGEIKFDLQAKNLKEDNLIEYGYEKLGLPLCEVAGDWIKVIYGYDQSGKTLSGWVELKKKVTNYFMWPDHLKTVMLFFDSSDGIAFFDQRNGKKKEFKLVPSDNLKYDYIMKPLEINGEWMKVQVTTPSDYCSVPEIKATQIFWIKFLDKNERPLVWYFPRGC